MMCLGLAIPLRVVGGLVADDFIGD
jgi:hypothetical protein